MNRNCKKIPFTDQILHIARANPTLIHYCTVTAPFYVVTVSCTACIVLCSTATSAQFCNFAKVLVYTHTNYKYFYIRTVHRTGKFLGFCAVSTPVQLMEIVTALQCMNSILMKFYRFCLLYATNAFSAYHLLYTIHMHSLSAW